MAEENKIQVDGNRNIVIQDETIFLMDIISTLKRTFNINQLCDN